MNPIVSTLLGLGLLAVLLVRDRPPARWVAAPHVRPFPPLAYRAPHLPARRRGSRDRATLDDLCRLRPRLRHSLRAGALGADPGPVVAALVARAKHGLAHSVEHGDQFHDQHQLAVVCRGGRCRSYGADGRADRPELPLRGHRPGRRRGPRARLARSRADRSATSGSTSSRVSLRVLLPISVLGALVLIAGGVIQNLAAPHSITTITGTAPRSSRADQWPRRRPSSCSAPMRRILQRQLRTPVREPERVDQPRRDHPGPRDPVRADPHLWADGRRPPGSPRRRRHGRLLRCRRSRDLLGGMARGAPAHRVDGRQGAALRDQVGRCSSGPRPPAPRPGRSTRCMRASAPSAAGCSWST